MTSHPIPTKSTSLVPLDLARNLALFAAAALSVAAGAIHLWNAPELFAKWWGYGAFSIFTALAQGLYAVALLRWPKRSLLLLGIAVNLGLVVLYATTRTAGIPFFGHHEAHTGEMLGTICVVVELALVAALVALARKAYQARLYLLIGIFQALGAGLVLYLLNSGVYGASGRDFIFHWLQTSAPSIPLSILVLWLSAPISRRLVALLYGREPGVFSSRIVWALLSAVLYASLAGHGFGGVDFEARDASVILAIAFLLVFAVSTLSSAPWEEQRAVDLWRPRLLATVSGVAAGVAFLAGPTIFGQPFSSTAEAQQVSCSAASYNRSYDVAAIGVEIPFNRWGGSDPSGQVFVLQGDKEAVRNWSTPLATDAQTDPAGNRRLRPRPLVLRANAGECVKVNFTNELSETGGDGLPDNPRASMKVFGPSYDAQTSDGSAVGFNDDTTVGRGESIAYFWQAPDDEGIYHFRDQGTTAGSEANSGSIAHGLYGAFVVEPAGSTWTDPTTGEPLYAGDLSHDRITKQSGDPYIDADINPPGGGSFRETIQLSQDELPRGNGFGFNYGAEPGFNRIAVNAAGEGNAEQFAPDAIGEETSLSSWTYGDPALIKLASGPGPWLPEPDGNGGRISREDCGLEQEPKGSCYVSNVTHSYPGDPTKIRFAHAGVKETHVFHMHAHQWLAEPGDVGNSGAPGGEITDANRPDSTTIDSQTYGPGESFTADLLYGAGSKPGTFGDSIFHCHLYPHFADGFWALFRVHDVYEDGTQQTPDGVNVRELKPLADRTAPSAPTADNPGYPRFMPGKFGWRAPQPPGGISESNGVADTPETVEREDLTEAKRVVAGRPLDESLDAADSLENELAEKLAVEKKVQELNHGAGNVPKPGAPFRDPCPTGSREVTYNVSVIQADITYNEAGWHDKQGRILVPSEDVDSILAGDKEPEPLFIRVNAGDCVNFNLTNRLPNWFGGDEFVELAQTNMYGTHIHLVKFDVLGSDGASNGWNYQQAAFSKDQADFNKNLDASNNVENCSWAECRVPDPVTYDPAQAGTPPGQTVHERWYADYELRTVFLHDHHFAALDQNRGLFGALVVEPGNMDFRDPRPPGDFFQPINDPANGPVCGTACVGTAAGTEMDVIGPGTGDDFREFGLAVQDFVSLHKSDADGGEAINAPANPEAFPDDDPGTMGINYRNAPFVLRQEKNGERTDPAHVFSSSVHGDPATPLLEAYSEDPVRVRVIQGSQEEQHVLNIHGMRWRDEPDDPESPLVNSKAIGVSEAFNFEIPKLTCGPEDETCAGDYLYSGTATDDLYLGMWGILRARGKEVPSLLPLPDNASPSEATDTEAPTATVPAAEGEPSLSSGSTAPPEANSPGTPCPVDAPVREYNVVAMQTPLQYNKHGDNDPYGLIYALAEDEAAIRDGSKQPEPLTLRANEGDCISVRLTNNIPADYQGHGNAGTDGDPTLPTEPASGTPTGQRVSLHPQLVKYDVRGSDGTAVGYNRDQTVAPGESRLYRWYADDVGSGEIGATNLTDFGDVRGHRHHGLFGGLNIEPVGATYHDPETGEEIKSGVSADIRLPDAGDFREFTTYFQDGLNLRDASGAVIEDPLDHPPTPEEPAGVGLDAEDMGEKGFDYANATFDHRLSQPVGPDPAHPPAPPSREMADVFNSRVHGDPDTPIFRAYAGDPIRMRVLQGTDKPRQHSFQVSGHSWKAQPEDPGSTRIGTQGGMSVGRAFNLHLSGATYPGDYRYGSGVHFHHLSGGLWGIMRFYPQPAPEVALGPTPPGETDDPRAGGHPILPLEVAATDTGISLQADPANIEPGGTTTLSGVLNLPGEARLSSREIVVEQRPEGDESWSEVPEGRLTTGDDGLFGLAGVTPEKTTDYRARFAGDFGLGLQPSTSEIQRVAVFSDTTPPTVTAPNHTFKSGSTLGARAVPVKIEWSATDDSDVVKYELQMKTKGQGFRSVRLASDTSTTKTLKLKPGKKSYKFRVRATDSRGNVSDFKTGPAFKVKAVQESSKAIADTGTWTTARLSDAYGGEVQHASDADRKATFALPAGSANVEWVSSMGDDRGKAEVWLDEAKVADVDLYSAQQQRRKVVFSQGGLDPNKRHELEVRVLGQKNASSSGTRVDVDAFVVTG